MLIYCDNKSCKKESIALLDTETMDVICQECQKPISNVSEPMKRTLKSFGQIVRKSIKRAFMLLCRSCRADRVVVLDQNNNTICEECYSPIEIHPAFKIAVEENGGFKKINTQDKKTKKKVKRAK